MALTADESYADVAYADTYWQEHNDPDGDWDAATDPAKEKALREASQYLTNKYRWRGTLRNQSQTLAWPRENAYDDDNRYYSGIPEPVKEACCELAVLALGGRLEPSKKRGNAIKSVKAGSVEVEYMDTAPRQQTFDFVRTLVSRLTVGTRSNVRLVRR